MQWATCLGVAAESFGCSSPIAGVVKTAITRAAYESCLRVMAVPKIIWEAGPV
jgi:hypothetical protein